MTFIIKDSATKKNHSTCLAIGLFTNNTFNADVQKLDDDAEGIIAHLLKQGSINCQLGQATLIYPSPSSNANCILVIGAGEKSAFDERAAKTWLTSLFKKAKEKGMCELELWYNTIVAQKIDPYQFVKAAMLIAKDVNYQFDQFKSKSDNKTTQLKELVLINNDKKLDPMLKLGLMEGEVIARAINEAKNLANMPPNVCNADYLAKQGEGLAKQFSSIKTTVLGKKELSKLGMRAYLAVGQGSANESKLTVMEYSGAKESAMKPIVLIGKGLTFDSGGISIKPATDMDEMKYDMCGAATVYGVMQAIAELELPINVVGLMAGCENMPSGSAYRPGDIITTLSGQNVEVINTDAEGRLVLCDSLTYAARYKPSHVIDIATLTGACVVALGHEYTGLVSNDDKLAKQLLAAAKTSGDKTWQLPMDDDFQKLIDSEFADIVNAAGRDAGAITAGCFLARFAKEYSWAHLDIAGTAWTSGKHKGATGRPVNLLVQFLLDKAKTR